MFQTILQQSTQELSERKFRKCIIICDYIIAEQTEINIKQSTKEGKIKILIWLSNFNLDKSFRHMTKQDILDYLNNLRKPITVDRTQKWAKLIVCDYCKQEYLLPSDE